MIGDLKCLAYSRNPTDVISFLGLNHAGPRARVGGPTDIWVKSRKRGKKKKGKKENCFSLANISTHTVNHIIGNLLPKNR